MNCRILLLIGMLAPLTLWAQVDLDAYFKKCQVEGSITIYDYKNQRWIYSDEKDARRESLPSSTFEIMNSLIALETGVVRDEKQVLPWDGRERTHKGRVMEAWNADTDMERAFENSTDWFYVEMGRVIGLKMYQSFLTKTNYGNGKITGGQDGDFWNYGPFGVSPYQQVAFLIALHENKLPFSKKSIDIVKRMMVEERNPNYTLRAQTGWSSERADIGWWVGYVETRDNVYFFATRLTKPLTVDNPVFANCRKTITQQALAYLGLVKW